MFGLLADLSGHPREVRGRDIDPKLDLAVLEDEDRVGPQQVRVVKGVAQCNFFVNGAAVVAEEFNVVVDEAVHAEGGSGKLVGHAGVDGRVVP